MQQGNPLTEIALAQMMDCLENGRTEPVTEKSIGFHEGEPGEVFF